MCVFLCVSRKHFRFQFRSIYGETLRVMISRSRIFYRTQVVFQLFLALLSTIIDGGVRGIGNGVVHVMILH